MGARKFSLNSLPKIILLLLVRPQNFTTSALIVYEANEAEIVVDLIGGTKGTDWYHSRLGPIKKP